MKTKSWVLVLSFVLAGCASRPVDPANDWKSGTRLRAQVYSAGATKLFKTWHDTKLDIDCTFVATNDGKTRCIPDAITPGWSFSDSHCTQPVFVSDTCADSTTDNYLYGSNASICTLPTQVFKADAATTSIVTYSLDLNGCNPSPTPSLVHTTTAVPFAAFVAATSAVQLEDDRLTLETLTGDDGSLQRRAISDSRRGYDCEVGFGELVDRCVPTHHSPANEFIDANCAQPVVALSYCEPPSLIETPPPAGSCPTLATLRDNLAEVGPPITAQLYENFSGFCEAASLDASESAYSIGAAIPASSLAPLSYTQEGGGQLVAQVVLSATGKRLRAFQLYDTHFNVGCNPSTAADGQLRCLAVGFAQGGLFADAACRQPAIAYPTACAPPSVAGAYDSGTGICESSKLHMFPVGSKLQQTMIYELDNGNCQVSQQYIGYDYYAEGEEIDPRLFQLVTVSEG